MCVCVYINPSESHDDDDDELNINPGDDDELLVRASAVLKNQGPKKTAPWETRQLNTNPPTPFQWQAPVHTEKTPRGLGNPIRTRGLLLENGRAVEGAHGTAERRFLRFWLICAKPGR